MIASPPGSYRFVVENRSIAGEPLNSGATMTIVVPLPFWKNVWFWAVSAAVLAILSTLYGRRLIRRRINRHLRHSQLIADERLRIARDLHDDLGTRLSHISLLGAYAESNIADVEARATFGQITAMSRELISALSETVWMLNPKNNQLEALVDFLCRLVSELCRLSAIRCRIDAMSVTENFTISHEFRHNVSLAVKEIVNNALKHSFATEIKMSIQFENNQLKITVTDNGVGITREPNKTGLGLESLTQRMASIKGKCIIDPHEKEGLKITLEAPIS
ncbi:MAG: histidine kinase [Luteolibacter sp.]